MRYGVHAPDGELPLGTLVQDTNGNRYGLGPFVEGRPAFGEVGTAGEILGTDLTRATSVSFNGIAATFTPWPEHSQTAAAA
jgi:hypothetical protein